MEAFKRDTPTWNWKDIKERLIFGGDYAENTSFVQFIADIVGFVLERPQTTAPCALGAMIAAGITMKVLDKNYAQIAYVPPSDAISPTTTPNRKLCFSRFILQGFFNLNCFSFKAVLCSTNAGSMPLRSV